MIGLRIALNSEITENENQRIFSCKSNGEMKNEEGKEFLPSIVSCLEKTTTTAATPSTTSSTTTTTTATTTATSTAIDAQYTTIFSHDARGGVFSSQADAANKNADSPDAYLFSILDQLEEFRGSDGKFRFKLCYPELTWGVGGKTCNEWMQTSNPMTETTITGFESVSLAFIYDSYLNPWKGLGKSPPNLPSSTIDDAPAHKPRYCSIGTKYFYRDKIHGPRNHEDWRKSFVSKVHLYVKGNRTTTSSASTISNTVTTTTATTTVNYTTTPTTTTSTVSNNATSLAAITNETNTIATTNNNSLSQATIAINTNVSATTVTSTTTNTNTIATTTNNTPATNTNNTTISATTVTNTMNTATITIDINTPATTITNSTTPPTTINRPTIATTSPVNAAITVAADERTTSPVTTPATSTTMVTVTTTTTTTDIFSGMENG